MSFTAEAGFCTNCGTILPILGDTGPVKCYMCKSEFGPEGRSVRFVQYSVALS